MFSFKRLHLHPSQSVTVCSFRSPTPINHGAIEPSHLHRKLSNKHVTVRSCNQPRRAQQTHNTSVVQCSDGMVRYGGGWGCGRKCAVSLVSGGSVRPLLSLWRGGYDEAAAAAAGSSRPGRRPPGRPRTTASEGRLRAPCPAHRLPRHHHRCPHVQVRQTADLRSQPT